MYPKISSNPGIQDAYERMRENGQSHNMAEILAFRKCPSLKTDTRFQARIDKTPPVPPAYRKIAKKAGVDTSDKQYFTQLARYPGDPTAWQSDRSSIKRICEERGWSCEGAITVKKEHEIPEDDGPYTVAESLVDQEVQRIQTLDPGAGSTPKKLEQLKDDTRTRLSGYGKAC